MVGAQVDTRAISRMRWVALLVVVFASAFSGALVALLIAVDLWQAGVLIAGAVWAIIVYWLLWKEGERGHRDAPFWFLLFWAFGSATIQSLTRIQADWVFELVLLFLAPLMLPKLVWWARRSTTVRAVLLLLAGFLLIAAMSSYLGRSKPLSAAFQVITNLKLYLLLLLGLFVTWSGRTEKVFWGVVRHSWILLLALIAVQWGFPAFFDALFPYSATDSRHFVPSLTRAVGPFRNPTVLGFYSAIFLLLSVLKLAESRQAGWYVSALAYAVALFASGQRQEMLGVIFCCALLYALHGSAWKFASRLLTGVVAVAAVFGTLWVTEAEYFRAELAKMGLVGHASLVQPRTVLYVDSVELANRYFPLGSGLGTFASAGAQKFDPTLYYDQGFGAFSWFGRVNVLSDTYWPQFFAEAGWIGFALYAAAFLTLLAYSVVRVLRASEARARHYALASFLCIAFAAFISLASPVLEDPGLMLVPAVLFGVAERLFRVDPVSRFASRQQTTSRRMPVVSGTAMAKTP